MGTWIAQHFFNPAFVAGGAALVASPIIIHLINRMRFRRVRFAAMEFLLQSQRRNRRRVLLEQLLLLLLRILIVLGLVALIARLILDPNQLSIFRGAKAHHLVLLDDSGSMRDRWGETTAFAEGVDVVKKLVAEGARRPDTQKFSLLLLSNPDQPVFSQRDVNDAFINELEAKIENLRCSHRALDLVAGLNAGKKLLTEQKATIKHLHVISDFRDGDWQNQKALSGAVRALDGADIAVNLVKTVPERHQNLTVTQLTGDVQVAAAGVPVHLKVAVKNFGEQVATDVPLTVVQDGQKLPLSIKFDKIEAGVEVNREFDITFDTPAKHRIQVGLAGDALSEDNTRFLAIDISAVNKVLIADGDPAGEEGAYLADALAADPSITGFAPQVEPVDYLRRRPLDEFQSIFLLNVSELSADAIEPLTRFVAGGGGLAWFLGDAVKPAFYSDKLFNGGQGIFPVRLALAPRELSHDDATTPGPDLKFADHRMFRVFEGQENPYIEATRVYRYFPVADDWVRDDQQRKDGVTTIAWLRNKQPLMFAHRFGKGRVVACLTTCGTAWNNWAVYASYVVMQLELQKHIARTDRTLEQRIVGQPIEVSLDPAEFTETIEITSPDLAGKRITRLKAAPDSSRRVPTKAVEPKSEKGASDDPAGDDEQPANEELRLAATFRDTDAPGIYTLKLLDQNQVPLEQWIAYNVPLEESELALVTSEQIRKQIGHDVRVQIQEAGSFRWIAGKDAGQEVREWLLIALVLLMVAEQLLAYRLSYHPGTAESGTVESGTKPAAQPSATVSGATA